MKSVTECFRCPLCRCQIYLCIHNLLVISEMRGGSLCDLTLPNRSAVVLAAP